MTRLKCTVSYVGRSYDGWQSQTSKNGIQDHLEAAISRIENHPVSIIGSGRTDAGVSARAQVFMFETDRNMSSYRWIPAINTFLPDDIHIMDVEEVPDTFHARHSVRWKKYTYRVNEEPYDVFTKDIAYQFGHRLDIERMKECAQLFIGTHDFTSFNSSPLSQYPDQNRTIHSIDVERNGNLIEITFCGKGFLRYMVRMLSAAMIDVGSGKITCDEVQAMLMKKDKRAGRRNAPACGLTLEKVDYLERIAVTPEVQIREYLSSDPLPYKTWDRRTIELNCRAKTGNRAYLYCRGIDMIPLGFLLITEHEAKLVVSDETGMKYCDDVRESIQKYLEKESCKRTFEVVDHACAEDVNIRF